MTPCPARNAVSAHSAFISAACAADSTCMCSNQKKLLVFLPKRNIRL